MKWNHALPLAAAVLAACVTLVPDTSVAQTPPAIVPVQGMVKTHDGRPV